MGLGCKSGPKVVPNGSSENYCKVSNGHVIKHVLVGQNRGSTVVCLVSWILFIRAHDYFPIMCTKDSITKWRGGKKISNFDSHSEINDWFLITSHILLGICLIDCIILLGNLDCFVLSPWILGCMKSYPRLSRSKHSIKPWY